MVQNLLVRVPAGGLDMVTDGSVGSGAPEAAPPPSGMPPTLNLAPRDVEGLAAELVAYHQLFAPLFLREEQRRWALKYLQGQTLDIERKSVEPMALALEGGNVQAMQQFIGVGAWQDEPILETHQRLVADSLGDQGTGVLIIDGSEFAKKGAHSVGVAHQHCGHLGKLANCQAGVFACYASKHGHTLVDRRLFLPEKWFTEAYRERRDECGVPKDLTFKKHHELAAAMIKVLKERAVLPFAWVTFDEDYGRATALLDQVEALGLKYLAEVAYNTRVYREQPKPVTAEPPAKRAWPDKPKALRVDALAETIPPGDWTRQTIKEGAKGPLVAEFACRRVVAVRDEKPGPAVWVVFRRSVPLDAADKPELKVYLSNAPSDTPKATFVWASGMRWPIESAIEECRGELGMDHYEMRGWKGWHHHMTMTLLSHHFLVRLRLRLGEKGGGPNRAPGPPVADRESAQAPARSSDRHRPHPARPAPEPQSLPLPPSPHPAPPR